MKKFEYENAVVYITIPNEEQIANIKRSTERFVRTLIKERVDIGRYTTRVIDKK